MTRITGITYMCDQCQKKEHDKDKVLNWLTVGILRNEIVPQRGPIETVWRGDFCSKGCLAQWAMNKTS